LQGDWQARLFLEAAPLAESAGVPVIGFLELELFRRDIGEVLKGEPGGFGFGVPERADLGQIHKLLLTRGPAEPRRFMGGPTAARSESPGANPFIIAVISVGVAGGDDQLFANEIMAEVKRRGLFRMRPEQIVGRDQLRRGPEFIAVDLPQEAFLPNALEGGVDHFQLAVPKEAGG